MFPFFSLLIISQILTVYGDLVEEKQYINDLKDDAKKEFIDRIIRRLAQEVDLKDIRRNGTTEESKKISDDQLDQHSDFVKKIINEEKTDFEKEVRNKNVSSEPRRLSNQSRIDYTLKEQTRKKRHENIVGKDNVATTEVNEVTIPVQTIYDVDQNKGTKNPANESSHVEKDDIQVKGERVKSRRSTQNEDTDLSNKSESEKTDDNSKKLDDSNSDVVKVVQSDKSKETNEVKHITEASEEGKTTVVSLENSTDNVKSTLTEAAVKEDSKYSKKPDETEVEMTTIDNREQSDQNKVHKEQDSISSNEGYLNDSNSETVTPKVKVSDVASQNITTLAKTAVNQANLPNATEKKALRDSSLVQSTVPLEALQKEVELNTHLTTISESELSKTTTTQVPITEDLNKTVDNIKRNKINDLTLTYNPYKTERVAKTNTSKIINEKVKIVKVGPSHKKIPRSILPTIQLKNILDRQKPMVIPDEMRTLEIAEDVLKALRLRIEKDTKNNKLALRNIPDLKQKEVSIYGLRSFDEEKSLETNREEPYYAPIYNYSPNNAYYNAYNKFGPNYEDSKDNRGKEPQETVEVIDSLNVPLETYTRSFFKKPIKFSNVKKVFNREPNTKNVLIHNLLPFISKKPYKLPQNDYEEYLGDDYNKEKNIFRYGNRIKEADESLKNHLRHIRNEIYLRKRGNKYEKPGEDERDNTETGWLDEDVKYYFENLKNVAKTVKPHEGFQPISYEYIDDFRFDVKVKNNKNIRYRDHVALANPINTSREVITRIKKVKDSSKEIVKKFQKVFPLLKNLVQIVDDDVDEETEACVKVLRDMINRNDEGLEQYDWLESTVNIQSAIGKLLDLTRASTEGLAMHPSDVELLKFTTYLFSLASEDLQTGVRSRSPKTKRVKGHFVNHKQLLVESNQWLVRVPPPRNTHKFEYSELRRFLNDLSDSLYDLHDALKHVSLVTNFKSQRWYGHLKDLYLHDPNKKKLLQVILHLGTTRLFNLIEDSSKNGADEDFRKYILENQTTVSGVKEAFVFVLKVLQAAVYS